MPLPVPSCVKIHEHTYHCVLPAEMWGPVHWYVDNPDQRRLDADILSLDQQLLHAIQEALTNINLYARSLRQLSQEPAEHVSLHLEWKEEIAAIIHRSDSVATGSLRTVVFWKRSELAPTFINPLHPLYEPLQYPHVPDPTTPLCTPHADGSTTCSQLHLPRNSLHTHTMRTYFLIPTDYINLCIHLQAWAETSHTKPTPDRPSNRPCISNAHPGCVFAISCVHRFFFLDHPCLNFTLPVNMWAFYNLTPTSFHHLIDLIGQGSDVDSSTCTLCLSAHAWPLPLLQSATMTCPHFTQPGHNLCT